MSDSVGKNLYDAADNGRVSEVSSLLRDNPDINVNWTSDSQWTFLHTASRNGYVEVVKLLLAHPAIDVRVKNYIGQTPLSFACEKGQVSVVELLLKDPRVDVTLDDNDGRTPLWFASREGKHEVIEWFIASGRDLGDVKNKKEKNWGEGKDYTALEIARENKKAEVVSVLEKFLGNPAQTRQEIRQKLKFTGLSSSPFHFISFWL